MLLNATLTTAYILLGEFGSLLISYGMAGYSFYFLTVLGLVVAALPRAVAGALLPHMYHHSRRLLLRQPVPRLARRLFQPAADPCRLRCGRRHARLLLVRPPLALALAPPPTRSVFGYRANVFTLVSDRGRVTDQLNFAYFAGAG